MAYTGRQRLERQVREIQKDLPPSQKLANTLRTLDPEVLELPEVKEIWKVLNKACEEIGAHINRVEQEATYQKCYVCKETIKRSPVGGLTVKTEEGLPLRVYTCSQSCHFKAVDMVEKQSRKDMEERVRP